MAGYGSDDGFTAFLDENGFSLPAGAPSKAALRQRGSVHVDAHTFDGAPTAGFAQDRAWPRVGATAYGAEVPSDVIPAAIVQASYAAGYYEAQNEGALSTRSSADLRIKKKRERVEGVVDEETEYFGSNDAVASATVTIPMVEGLLAPYVGSAGVWPAAMAV